MWPLILFQNLMERERHAICRRSIDRPVTAVNLSNTQWAREGETVGGATHFRSRRDNVDVPQLAKRSFKSPESIRMDAVVVR